jgi:hypothetical protein
LEFRIGDKTYELDETRILLSEVEAIERYAGEAFDAIQKRAQAGYISALKPFVWLALRRNGDGVKYSELDFNLADFEVIPGDEEAPKDEASAKK